MKKETTMKYIKNNYKNIIKTGYCDIQHLTKGLVPTYYTTGVYGWNCDIYVVSCATVITTGYRPFGNIRVPKRIFEKYKNIVNEYGNNNDLENYCCEIVQTEHAANRKQAQTDEEFWNMIEKIESGWRDGSWKYV